MIGRQSGPLAESADNLYKYVSLLAPPALLLHEFPMLPILLLLLFLLLALLQLILLPRLLLLVLQHNPPPSTSHTPQRRSCKMRWRMAEKAEQNNEERTQQFKRRKYLDLCARDPCHTFEELSRFCESLRTLFAFSLILVWTQPTKTRSNMSFKAGQTVAKFVCIAKAMHQSMYGCCKRHRFTMCAILDCPRRSLHANRTKLQNHKLTTPTYHPDALLLHPVYTRYSPKSQIFIKGS